MNSLLQSLRNLGPGRLLALAGVAAATIAFFVFVVTRLSTPPMRLLYSDLDLRDSGAIVTKLTAMNEPYEIKGDGAQILVPQDDVARLRMTMAAQDLPSGGSVGYEIFDKSEPLGTSTFEENINKLRALEGELSRTIASLDTVAAARVHLVLARRELFSRDQQQPSASIVLKLRDTLSKGQVAAIQHLVAAAVPELQPNRVVIVDTDGTLLTHDGAGDADGGGGGESTEDLRAAYETQLRRSVEDMLERTLGRGRVRVEIHADMNFDRVTTNTETYDPNGQVTRSTQTMTETSATGAAGGAPPVSVTTNLPQTQAKKTPAAGGTQSTTGHKEETTNYEISKTVERHVHIGGTVERLSVAVLVDGTYKADGKGPPLYEPRSPAELAQLTTLVQSAIGYDKKRGDTVEVVNLRFAKIKMPAAETPKTYFLGLGKDDLFRIGESGGLVVAALLVILLVVRPLMKRIFETLPAAGAPEILPQQRLLTHQDHGGNPALMGPDGNAVEFGHAPDEIEQMIDIGRVEGRVRASSMRKVGEIVDKHPEEAVAIVRSWMYQQE